MTATQLARWQRIIVLAHALLAVLYGVIIPPYEAHDETGHFAYLQHLVTQHSLPDARAADKAFLDQSHQPPLYYLITGALIAWSDPADAAPPRNLFAFDGSNRRGVRILLRQPGEDFPWHGSILALHAARLASALLSTLMIVVITRAARQLFPDAPGAALITTAIAAFNPQVLFMAAMVNNDVMVSLTGALTAFAALRLNAAPKARNAIVLGLALGLSLASKNSALALLGFVAGALLVMAWRQRWPLRALISRGAMVYGAAALVAAPHYLYNLTRYGQLLVDREADNKILTQQSLFTEGVAVGLRDAWLPRIFVNAFRTFWGTFGWGNVQQPDWVYWTVFAFCMIGLASALLALRRANAERRTQALILAGLIVAMLLLPTYRAISFQDPALLPGRYLMPSLLGYAALLGLGWHALAQRIANVQRAILATLAAWALIVPLALLRPAYSPALESAPDSPAILTFGDAVSVHAIDARTVFLPDREGARHYARVRVTWRALRPTVEPYAIGVTVLGRNNEALGSINVYPQRGNYPSTVWTPGATFTDEYDILLEKPCAALPALGRVALALFTVDVDPATRAVRVKDRMSALDAEGRPVDAIVGRFKIDAPPLPYPIWWQEPRVRFDGAIGLRDIDLPETASPGQPLRVGINYDLLAPLSRDAQVFVHALDAQGKLVAQDDHAPFGGTYPSNLWDPGDCARERFTLNIPADFSGSLQLVTGWYDAVGRLRATTAFDAAQPELPDGLAPVGRVVVK